APSKLGRDGEAIDRPTPSVPPCDDRADDPIAVLSHDESEGVAGDQTGHILEVVRVARLRARGFPQRENPWHVVGLGGPHCQVHGDGSYERHALRVGGSAMGWRPGRAAGALLSW